MPVDFFKGSQNIEVIVTNTTSTLVEQAVSHYCEEFYPNISTILQLLLTLPVGSCSCERSFTSLRRLNGLALAYIHKPTEIESSSVLKEMGCLCPSTDIDRLSFH